MTLLRDFFGKPIATLATSGELEVQNVSADDQTRAKGRRDGFN